jgi:hypothetical protein
MRPGARTGTLNNMGAHNVRKILAATFCLIGFGSTGPETVAACDAMPLSASQTAMDAGQIQFYTLMAPEFVSAIYN